jgi:aspartyl aminopeptidase
MTDKTAMQALQDKLLMKRQHAAPRLNDKAVRELAEEYRLFITENKTEREVVSAVKKAAEKAGFADIHKTAQVEKGGLYYRLDGQKNLALIRFSGLRSIHGIISHADSPCLHLKPFPIAESHGLAVFKTHYYGGIKKYQWLNIPLALRGVAINKKGERIDIRIGDAPSDPVFTIPDLLPHLAREQLEKKANDLVSAEQLNPIMASVPVEDEKIKDKVKLALAKALHERYGLIEEDLVSAELSFVPAGEARMGGLDQSLIIGYGHDDRSSVYTSMKAFLDSKSAGHTQIVVFYDKEEVGSFGKSSANNQFFTNIIEELIEASESDLRPSQVWQRTRLISADVTSAVDPNFSDAHDTSNASYLGRGVSVEKFGGARGKYYTNDADAEYTHELLQLFNNKQVPWQSGENGKLDLGGGGTISMFFAKEGADVIDIGVPVLGMHAPYEVLSTHDLYSAYLSYRVFLEESR